MDLMDHLAKQAKKTPLADRMRPTTLDELLGQDDILGPGKLLRRAIEDDRPFSMILWGPPGSGKTTLARVIAGQTDSHFANFSAVTAGVKEVRALIAEARERLGRTGKRTILFVDEIHRFNKAQQDAFLPHVEDGTVVLIGATTENPSFEVNSALLSRTQVFVLKPLGEDDLARILARAIADPDRGLGAVDLAVDDGALAVMARLAGGDARKALNALEIAAANAERAEDGGMRRITEETAKEAFQRVTLLYDKAGDQHYDLISAFHKAMRGSDPQAALYYLGRMLEAGEDPLYVARRMIRFASEDVGLADPQALVQALAAKDAVHFVGLPEGNVALAQAAVYLATAPKSNALYAAYDRVKEEIQRSGPLPVPLHIRNAPTRLMKNLGYAEGYVYAHDFDEAFVAQEYLPEGVKVRRYYEPGPFGFEKDIRRRLDYWQRLAEKGPKPKKQ